MSMATFSVMGSSIMTMGIRLVQERAEGWAKFMRITPLPYSVYFFSKIVGQSVVHILSIVVILPRALDGKGAFRRFKDMLVGLNLEEEWFSFKEAYYRKLAIRWCEDLEIE